jgi:hypothetical protein
MSQTSYKFPESRFSRDIGFSGLGVEDCRGLVTGACDSFLTRFFGTLVLEG